MPTPTEYDPRILFELCQVQSKKGNDTFFENLNFTWKKGEHWVIVGNEGDVLTEFLQVLYGNRAVGAGTVVRPFATAYAQAKIAAAEVYSFRDLIAYVGQSYPFRNKSNQQNFYYQQRFNSMDAEDTACVREYLMEIPKRRGFWNLANVSALLRLDGLQEESLIKLSNGESRRLAIAVALMQQPQILLLDQPLTGLDAQTRVSFNELLTEFQKSGLHILMTSIPSEIPEAMTHVGLMRDKKLVPLKRTDFHVDFVPHLTADWSDRIRKLPNLLQVPQSTSGQDLVFLKDVTIRYKEKVILQQLNWQIKEGERWQLKGPNGAGKSTLVSLLIGEHPQAYSNHIELFGRKRGTGESIWDIKQKIGFVAPELSRYFPKNQTVRKVLLSGFFDTMGLFRKQTHHHDSLATQWLTLLGLLSQQNQLFTQLSLAEQRLLLLARALIKSPQLLIVDEGVQGLDIHNRQLIKKMLEEVLKVCPIAMIYVSHYDEDIPLGVNQIFELPSPQRH
jgi:molybdate transport system ATP-binding protein